MEYTKDGEKIEFEDLTGIKVGTFTVKKLKRVQREPIWLCECECGRLTQFGSYRLTHKNIHTIPECHFCRQSFPLIDDVLKRRYYYNKWLAIKSRCLNPKNPAYKNYGGRGIYICDEWKNGFNAFFSYIKELEHYDEPGRSIDRIDNNDGYRPGNIRWATRKEQMNNTRRSKHAKKTD